MSPSAKPTEVTLSEEQGNAALHPFEMVGGAPVFLSRWGRGAAVTSMLLRLQKVKPEVYAQLVAAVVEEMR